MPVFVNLMLVLLLISTAGAGGYLLARAHFAATIANRVMAYQARLARSQRDGKQAHKDVARLEAEVAILSEDLTRARGRVSRYEVALFEGYPASEVDLEAAAAAVNEQSLQQQAAAYVQRVHGVDDFDRAGDQDVAPVAQRRGLEQMSRAIA
ncbi:hypothetical protein KUL25_17350 [Rhodobacteraceae bacterium N5(2021)]|uniref:Uncharacterized protein n=1 Tax=Gymnodinialimonas phycosphaerae TaxID=2841589 RepID=A0A975TTQ3_9RHOB|nr:hypothetical protein [Gymnodinialimonas phycosphaerae]MBY4894527.1 hypothetical protein [Gymnodinialimonas phycosphaerae]